MLLFIISSMVIQSMYEELLQPSMMAKSYITPTITSPFISLVGHDLYITESTFPRHSVGIRSFRPRGKSN